MRLPVLLLVLLPVATFAANVRPCNLREISDTAYVCECNITYCDDVAPLGTVGKNQGVLYYTSQSGSRLQRTALTPNGTAANNAIQFVVDSSITYQTMLGFGGAFTDSAGINLNSLPANMSDFIINQYYSEDGLGYSMGRVPMASCDFSTREYSYCDTNNDFNLTTFNLTAEDYRYKIPFIVKAQTASNNQLRLFSTPWSAPGWMKSNGRMKGGGVLKGDMNGQYYQTWANYFVRFFEEYHKNGIDFWGTTIQNEPTSGLDPFWKWQTMYLSAAMERDFLKGTLGPTLQKSPYAQNLSIMILDDQRTNLPTWPDTILSDPDAAKFVSGIALHWYEDAESSPSLLTQTHNAHPNYFIFGTEACTGYLPLQGKPALGSWSRAEQYANDMMQDIMNWSAGWMDWNLALDMNGGPNWVGNFVDSPIIVDSSRNVYYKNPMWHTMGHFSKFVRPGSLRVSGQFQNLHNANLEGVAFKTPNGNRVAIVLNKDTKKSYTVAISEESNFFSVYNVVLEPNSIVTLVFN